MVVRLHAVALLVRRDKLLHAGPLEDVRLGLPLAEAQNVFRRVAELLGELRQTRADGSGENLEVDVELAKLANLRRCVREVAVRDERFRAARLDLLEQRGEVGLLARIVLVQHHLEAELLRPLHGSLRRLAREEAVLADDGDSFHTDVFCDMNRALLVVLGDRDDVEQILAALLPDDARRGARRHRGVLVPFEDVGHGVGDAARVGADGQVHLVLRDQLLVELETGLLVRFVVQHDEVDFLAVPSFTGVHLIHVQLVRVHHTTGGLGVAARLRNGDPQGDLVHRVAFLHEGSSREREDKAKNQYQAFLHLLYSSKWKQKILPYNRRTNWNYYSHINGNNMLKQTISSASSREIQLLEVLDAQLSRQ